MLSGRRVISNIPGECTHYIDTKGTSELNKWDEFGEGLNAYNWPKTKKKIVQEIRKIKIENFDILERLKIGERLQAVLSKEFYVKKIYELAGIKHVSM